MTFTERDLATGEPATIILGLQGKEYGPAGLVDGPLPTSGEFGFAIGERVEVVPEYFTGEWLIVFQPPGS